LSVLGLPGFSEKGATWDKEDGSEVAGRWECRFYAALTVLLTQDERVWGDAAWPNPGAWTAAKQSLLEALQAAYQEVRLLHLHKFLTGCLLAHASLRGFDAPGPVEVLDL
jgi:hypothetical protein